MSDPRDRSSPPPPPPTATVRRPAATPDRGAERLTERLPGRLPPERAPERPPIQPAERAADRIAERVAERMAERRGERPPETRATEPRPAESRAGEIPSREPRPPEARPADARAAEPRGPAPVPPRARDLLRAEVERAEGARTGTVRSEAPVQPPPPPPAPEPPPVAPEPVDTPTAETEAPLPGTRGARGSKSRPLSPIVPGATVTGTALVAVIAIMTFLAGLTIGAVASVRTLASGWTSEIAREVTIQIKPAEGLDIPAALAAATQAARATPGVAAASALDEKETAALLEPWLGAGIDVETLPVPRLVTVTLAPDAGSGVIPALRAALAARVPSASLDDHRQWSARLSSTARAVVMMGLAVLALVCAATVLSVVFATRAAVAAGRSIVEVLHFVGARDSLIAAEFQHHFLAIGLKGGAAGGGAAMALFFALTHLPRWFGSSGAGEGVDTLIGGMSLDLRGYGGILGVVVLVALVVSATSRLTVHRTLRSIN